MKKTILFLVLVLFTTLGFSVFLSSCYPEPEKIYGKTVVYNEAGSDGTITRITIVSPSSMLVTSDATIYQERVSIAPGEKSKEYELEVVDKSRYRVTITANDQQISATITVADKHINNLYYNGTSLVER